jgi:threonine dehydrogenase-like Zn-dependent dehydrogenase
MVLAAAVAAGAAPLIAIDRNKDRLAIAGKMGANILLNPDETDIIKEAVDVTQAGPDFAFSCVSSGVKGVLEQAFEMVRRKGRVIIVGNSAPATFATSKWMTKEVRVEGVVHRGQKMYHALKLMEYKRVNVRQVITEIIPLVEAQRAFESLRDHKNLAVLLKP